MADPKLAKIIGVKVAGANVGEYVILRNLTRGGQLTDKVSGTDRGVAFNAAPATQWREKDKVQAEIRGRLQGVVQGTIESGGIREMKITATADTTTPEVSL